MLAVNVISRSFKCFVLGFDFESFKPRHNYAKYRGKSHSTYPRNSRHKTSRTVVFGEGRLEIGYAAKKARNPMANKNLGVLDIA
jgi:hypothetical protein